EIIIEKNAISAKNCIAELQLLLEKEKADIETSKDHTEQENAPENHNAKMHEESNAYAENQMQVKGNILHINNYWDRWKKPFKRRKKNINDIISKLQEIRKMLIK
nr:hypothetical protein [Tanacetum cinerariifolium]